MSKKLQKLLKKQAACTKSDDSDSEPVDPVPQLTINKGTKNKKNNNDIDNPKFWDDITNSTNSKRKYSDCNSSNESVETCLHIVWENKKKSFKKSRTQIYWNPKWEADKNETFQDVVIIKPHGWVFGDENEECDEKIELSFVKTNHKDITIPPKLDSPSNHTYAECNPLESTEAT